MRACWRSLKTYCTMHRNLVWEGHKSCEAVDESSEIQIRWQCFTLLQCLQIQRIFDSLHFCKSCLLAYNIDSDSDYIAYPIKYHTKNILQILYYTITQLYMSLCRTYRPDFFQKYMQRKTICNIGNALWTTKDSVLYNIRSRSAENSHN